MNRSVEDQLRERLHEVDSLGPASADFEFRALRAGRDRMRRRRSWVRGLTGAAAAVAVGVLAVPVLGRLEVGASGSSSSAVAGAAPNAESAAPPAPGLADKQGSGGADSGAGAGNGAANGADPGSDSTAVSPALAALRDALRQPPYDLTVAGVTLEWFTSSDGTASQWVVVHGTAEDAQAMATARTALPSGSRVTFSKSLYSFAQCQQTKVEVAGDVDAAVGSLSQIGGCDEDGRLEVDVTAGSPVADAVIQHLDSRYGNRVAVHGVPHTAFP